MVIHQTSPFQVALVVTGLRYGDAAPWWWLESMCFVYHQISEKETGRIPSCVTLPHEGRSLQGHDLQGHHIQGPHLQVWLLKKHGEQRVVIKYVKNYLIASTKFTYNENTFNDRLQMVLIRQIK